VKRRLPVALPASALGALLAACSFAPAYKAPPDTGTAPAVYKEIGDWKQAQPVDAQPRGAWWTQFNDAQLNALEDQVSSANQDLKAAVARLQEARAQAGIARADLFPTLTLGPSLTRQRVSTNGPHYSPGAEPSYNDFLLEADLSYEIDVWGRVRNTLSAANATAQASAADLVTLDLSTHAELATDYFSLRGADNQQALLDQTVADYTKALELEQHLYDGGAAALSDLVQAQAQLETAITQAADVRLQRAQLEHAIAVLIGQPASSFHLDAMPLPAELGPPGVDPGLPSALLERRPDVAAAERRVFAANANVGVARAAYFPVFSLTASAGYDSTHSSNWIQAPSNIWSVGPSALLTVFDAGRHASQSAQAHAAYDEQVADYRGSVLNAYREVEDNIAALRQLEQETTSQAAAVTASQKALQQAQYRYKGGIVTYLEVVTTENAALQAELSAANIQTRRLNAAVLLVKALGGGWQTPLPRQADASTPAVASTDAMASAPRPASN
jgi:NodT family efflux transporter outer membrane factor (OMF) lipoprotein